MEETEKDIDPSPLDREGMDNGDSVGALFWRWVRKRKLLVAGLTVAGWLVVEWATLPFGDISELKNRNPRQTAFMRDRIEEAEEEGRQFRIVQQWVSLRSIPRDVINAVVVAEDGQFWSHGGFDWFEFKESLEVNVKEGRAVRGASTITQQLVKNLYLSPSKNPVRKLREWVLTIWMEWQLGKSRILEIYLNCIEWGNGIYGIEAASQSYFGKPASELTRDEGARLAAIIPSPRRYRANDDSPYVQRRMKIILERMEARGM